MGELLRICEETPLGEQRISSWSYAAYIWIRSAGYSDQYHWRAGKSVAYFPLGNDRGDYTGIYYRSRDGTPFSCKILGLQ